MAAKKKTTKKKTAAKKGTAKKKELAPGDPDFLPVQYDMTKANLARLAKDYDPALIPKATEKGDDGYQIVHDKVMAITKVRTKIEAKRKELKADALSWGKLVDGKAKELTAAVEALEAPWKELKTDLDEKEAREAEEARQKEAAEMAEIEEKIAGIKRLADGLVGASAETLRLRIEHIDSLVIDEEGFGYFVEPANLAKNTVHEALSAALEERMVFEQSQAKLVADQEKMAAAQKVLDDQQAALDKQKKEQDDREAADKAAKEKKEREAEEEKERLEREEIAAEAEKKRLADEAETKKKRDAELEARKPEDQKVREYANTLQEVPVPDVKDPDLMKLVGAAYDKVESIYTHVMANTQGE